ncbi:hypothetical protein BDR26DRAFT_284241 [Obelidium mucronatum]|nr:hypothetical protein BDR26DRAFT_284241 [Obelidium mucronatum]
MGFKLLAKSGFTSLCWSRKGKQLAVGDKLGVIRQVSLEGIIKNVISPPSVFDEARAEVTHISWLEDKTFVVVYKRGDQSQTYVITQTGSAAAGGTTEYARIENSNPRNISTHGWNGISSALIQMDSTETLLFALTSTGGLLVYAMKDSSSTEYETLGAETITKPTASMPPTGMLLEFDIVEIEWTCKSCLVRNLDKATECICCGWSKADLDPPVTSPTNETSFDGFDSKPLPFAPRGTNFSALQSLANSKHFKPKSQFVSAQTAFQDMMRFR